MIHSFMLLDEVSPACAAATDRVADRSAAHTLDEANGIPPGEPSERSEPPRSASSGSGACAARSMRRMSKTHPLLPSRPRDRHQPEKWPSASPRHRAVAPGSSWRRRGAWWATPTARASMLRAAYRWACLEVSVYAGDGQAPPAAAAGHYMKRSLRAPGGRAWVPYRHRGHDTAAERRAGRGGPASGRWASSPWAPAGQVCTGYKHGAWHDVAWTRRDPYRRRGLAPRAQLVAAAQPATSSAAAEGSV